MWFITFFAFSLQAFTRLTTLAEQRGEAYANADARVCLESMFLTLYLPWKIKDIIHLSIICQKFLYPCNHLILIVPFKCLKSWPLSYYKKIAVIASKQGHSDVCTLTPIAIAIEVSPPTSSSGSSFLCIHSVWNFLSLFFFLFYSRNVEYIGYNMSYFFPL